MVTYREIHTSDDALLREFLWLAIFLPPGTPPPARDIIFRPELCIYIENFGGEHDCGVIAEMDGQAIGAAWTRIIPGFGHIDDATPELAIAVLPEHRNQGVGAQLLETLCALLSSRGYEATSLAVQKANPAVRLYTRAGYAIIAEKSEEYIMVKKL